MYERGKQNLWDQARTGRGTPSAAERQRRAQESLENISESDRENLGILEIRLSQIRDIMTTVTNKMEEYHADVELFKEENSKPRENASRFEKTYNSIVPDINPREEARKLREVINALDEFMQINGYQLAAAPNDESELIISFEPIKEIVFGPGTRTDQSLAPEIDLNNIPATPTEV